MINKTYMDVIHIRGMALAFLLCLLTTICLNAQQLDNFSGLKSGGKLLKQITTNSSQTYKVLETSTDLQKEVKRKKRKQTSKFYLESTFAIDEMMKTGLILFNEPVSEYVGQVADQLLKHDPNTRSKLNFYVARSPQINAFATDRGDIFINIGLLTYLETEAQLAFILAHEITHWVEKHNMDVFLEYEGIDSSDKSFRKKSDFSKILEKSNYSKKIEEEADADGIKLFLKSSYGTGSLENVFNMLASGHAPYTNEAFDLSYLEVSNVEFSDSLLLASVNPIEIYEEDHELSTHPGVKKRRSALKTAINKANVSSDKSDFQLGEQKFKNIKELAKFEVCRISVEQFNYYDALYYASILSKTYPDNRFLATVKAKSLYGIAKLAGEFDDNTLSELGDSIQGEIQQVYHVIGNFSDIELRSLAAAHLWEFHQKNPDDEGMKLRLSDLLMEIKEKDRRMLDDLWGAKNGKGLKTASIFSEMEDNKAFNKMLNEERLTPPKLSHQNLEDGYRLGLRKVTFVNPYYLSVNLRKSDTPIQFLETENKQEEMVDAIKKRSRKLKINSKIMDVNSLSRNTKSEKFNNIITLERWLQQKIVLPEGMIPDNHNEAVAVMKKNKTGQHLAFIGALSLKAKKARYKVTTNTLAILTGILAPYGVAGLIKPNNKSMYYAIVVDTKSQDVVMTSYNVMSQKDAKTITNTNLHWLLLQMKRKPKR